MMDANVRIPDEVLAEQWFGFVHRLIEGMQLAHRGSAGAGEISQKEIAERLGKKPSFVSRCLSGQQNMTIRTIHDLARAMDCRLEIAFRPLRSVRRSNNPATPPSNAFRMGAPAAGATANTNYKSVIQDSR